MTTPLKSKGTKVYFTTKTAVVEKTEIYNNFEITIYQSWEPKYVNLSEVHAVCDFNFYRMIYTM